MTEQEIQLSLIDPNPFQVRKQFNQKKIEGLAQSIEEQGLLQKIELRSHNGRYQISYGDYRVHAFKFLKRNTIPAEIRELSDLQMQVRAFVENVHRTDLTFEEREESAWNLWNLKDEQGNKIFRTQDELSSTIGLSPARISHLLRAYDLRMKHALGPKVSTDVITETAGLTENEQVQVIKKVESGELGVRELRQYVQSVKAMNSVVRAKVIKESLNMDDVTQIAEVPKEKQEEFTDFTVKVGKQVTGIAKELEKDKEYVAQIYKGEKPPVTVLESDLNKIFGKYKQWYSGVLKMNPAEILGWPPRFQNTALNWIDSIIMRMTDVRTELLDKLGEVKVVESATEI